MSTKGGMTYGAEAVTPFVEDPQPGAYFTDHLSPVCFVEEREPHSVCVRMPDRKAGVWGDTKWMRLDDFKRWLSYDSTPGCWVEHRAMPKWIGQLG